MKVLAILAMITFVVLAAAEDRSPFHGIRERTIKTDNEEITWYDDGSISPEMIEEMIQGKVEGINREENLDYGE
jgi:hypothetical protein